MRLAKDKEKVGNDIYGVKKNWKLMERAGETSETGFRHNDHYHKYFHGYTEIRIPKANGGCRIERYYTDDWYVQETSDARWAGTKILYLSLTVFILVGYFYLMTRPGLQGNTSRIVAIPGFLAVPFLVLLLASAIGYAVTKRRMTWWEHEASSKRVTRYALIAGILLLLTGVFILLNIWTGVEHTAAEVALALGVMVTAAASFAMFYLEKKMCYKTEKNEVKLPPGEAHLIM